MSDLEFQQLLQRHMVSEGNKHWVQIDEYEKDSEEIEGKFTTISKKVDSILQELPVLKYQITEQTDVMKSIRVAIIIELALRFIGHFVP